MQIRKKLDKEGSSAQAVSEKLNCVFDKAIRTHFLKTR